MDWLEKWPMLDKKGSKFVKYILIKIPKNFHISKIENL